MKGTYDVAEPRDKRVELAIDEVIEASAMAVIAAPSKPGATE